MRSIAVYAAGAASHWLTVPGVIARAGLWPFVLAQAVLIWIWFVLHAKRLRDAGRRPASRPECRLLYALSVVLLLIVAASFFTTSANAATGANATSALGLILLLFRSSRRWLGSLELRFSAGSIVAILMAMAVRAGHGGASSSRCGRRAAKRVQSVTA